MKQPSENKQLLAPKPTKGTLFMRTFLPWQILRFFGINLKMMRMMHLEHKSSRDHSDHH